MKNWMRELAIHYERARERHPQSKLIILFDIDGTILDMRYMIHHVLQGFDRSHGMRFFRHLRISDIDVHENHVEVLLEKLRIPSDDQKEIMAWFLEHRWSSSAIMESYRPFRGVLEVVRWFQLQPKTCVGLNTGRPESLRADTLRSLNALAKEYRVEFTDELLYMNPRDWEEGVKSAKVAGVEHFQRAGYHVFAVVDNEPDNLRAISKADPEKEILLLHANTIFESKATRIPPPAVRGKVYDLTELISERVLPRHIQFVWHGVNQEANLRQFLASNVHWAELDVRIDPDTDDVILRHDGFEETPLQEDEGLLLLGECLARIKGNGRGAKLDLKENGRLVNAVLRTVKAHGFKDSQLWFNGQVERLREEGFREIAKAHPSAIIQCAVDFVAPLILGTPKKAKEILDIFTGWGINRFSLSWLTPHKRQVFEQLDRWGFEMNIYNLPDLEAFLQAALLLPRSITSDFNFPKWSYYGQGSGENLRVHEYSALRPRMAAHTA
jgi:hypothetical protein